MTSYPEGQKHGGSETVFEAMNEAGVDVASNAKYTSVHLSHVLPLNKFRVVNKVWVKITSSLVLFPAGSMLQNAC